MATIKVMSWNIQNLGASKFGLTKDSVNKLQSAQLIVNYIKTVVTANQIDVLTISEIRSFLGRRLGEMLCKELGEDTWKACHSSQQTSNRKEQYLYIWNSAKGISEAEYAKIISGSSRWLYGIVDYNLLKPFAEKENISFDEIRQVLKKLEENGYLSIGVASSKEDAEKVRSAREERGDDDPDFFGTAAAVTSEKEKLELEKKQSFRATRRGRGQPPVKYQPEAKSKVAVVTPSPSAVNAETEKLGFSYRIIPKKWQQLNGDKNFYDATGNELDLNLTPDQTTALAKILVDADYVLFPVYEERSLFFLQLQLGAADTSEQLLLASYHAPSPEGLSKAGKVDKKTLGKRKAETQTETNVLKFPAIDCISQCTNLVNATNILVMGDFNVESTESGVDIEFPQYGKSDASSNYDFKQTQKSLTQRPFASITGNPLNLTCLMDMNTLTSIKKSNTVLDETYNSGNPTVARNYMKSSYDKFFFTSKNNTITTNNSKVVDLVDIMCSKSANYNSDTGVAGLTFYFSRNSISGILSKFNALLNRINSLDQNPNKYSGIDTSTDLGSGGDDVSSKRATINNADQQKKLGISRNAESVQNTITQLTEELNNNAMTYPPNSVISFMVYEAISDHMPISTEINYTVSMDIDTND